LAHIVEHPLGWTLRLDRIEYQDAADPPDPKTVLGAMLPNAHRAMWTLPKLEWIDVSLFPCICVNFRGRLYTVAMVLQTRGLAKQYFATQGLLSTPPKEPPVDAICLDPMQYVFFSELAQSEWNPDVTLFGEPIDPIASLVAAKFARLHNLPNQVFPIVVYHGTLGTRAGYIKSQGFDAPRACGFKGSNATDVVCQVKCTEAVCRCRMLGPAVYGTTFGRALAFASTRFARGVSDEAKFSHEPADLGVVRFAVMTERVMRKTCEPCECGCDQRFVDHLGLWTRQSDCVILPSDSEPASKYVEIAVADARKCLVLSMGKWQRRYAKTVESKSTDSRQGDSRQGDSRQGDYKPAEAQL
jgi:hypothetical protein